MTAVTHTTVTATGDQFAGVNGAIANTVAGVKRWMTYREIVADLRTLSDKQLTDIGVGADIEAYAWDVASQSIKGSAR